MKPCKTKFVAIASVFIFLTGCVTDGNQYSWAKTSTKGNIEQERAAADSACMASAYETFTAQPMPSNTCIGTCVNNRGGFSDGFLAGTAARQSREIRNAREQFYENCMIGKGWEKRPVR